MMNTRYRPNRPLTRQPARHTFALLCATLLAGAATAAEPVAQQAAPARTASAATVSPSTGSAVKCPEGSATTAPAGNSAGTTNSQGAVVKGPVIPKCPGDTAGKVVKPVK